MKLKTHPKFGQATLALSLLVASTITQAEVTTMACTSFDATHTLARLFLKNALLTLQERLGQYSEAGVCDQITIPDKSHMVKMEKGQADLDQWLIETNALAANFERPPITEKFFFVSITLAEGEEVYSLESTRFIE